MPFQNLLVVFADKVWKVGPEGLGILSASAGAGGLIGAVLVAWRTDHKRLRSMIASAIAFGALLFAFALSPWYALALLLVFVANIFASYYSTANNTAIQMLVPDEVRGRVSSLLMMSFALPLLGTLAVVGGGQAVGCAGGGRRRVDDRGAQRAGLLRVEPELARHGRTAASRGRVIEPDEEEGTC